MPLLAVTGICLLPFILIITGVDLSSTRDIPVNLPPSEVNFHQMSGAFTHTILEWTGFCAAIFTVILAINHYRMTREITIPVIAVALFMSGIMDAFHTLAADRLIDSIADNNDLVPFTWAICRMFNAVILVFGVGLVYIRSNARTNKSTTDELKDISIKDLKFFLVVCLTFFVIAWLIIDYCATSQTLPATQFPDSWIKRPYDIFPLFFYIFAGIYLFPRFYQKHPGAFSYALIVAMVPESFVGIYMAFGSVALFDSYFNAAHWIKILAYVIPLFGIMQVYFSGWRKLKREIYDRRKAEQKLSHEIYQHEQTELVLIEKRKEAEEASRAKSTFLATMSHEIRTPMNGMLGMTQILMKTPLNDEQQAFVSTIYDSGNALMNVLNDVLDFSKIEAGKMNIDPQNFNLEKCAFDVCQLMMPNAEKKDIEVVFSYDPECPTFWIGDEGRIRQIISNLLSNAVKFTLEGHVQLNISYPETNDELPRAIQIKIKDTGIGMPPDVANSIFEPFHQADVSTTRQFGGTGLGLAICQSLAELMGGSILVTSKPGEGSEFTVSLPLEQGSEVTTADVINLQGVRCLIIDDIEINCDILAKTLTHEKMIVDTVTSGSDAIQLLLKKAATPEKYDIVIIDYYMPVMDGLTLAQIIAKEPSLANIKILFISSGNSTIDAQKCRNLGFSHYLHRPVHNALLFKTLKEIIMEEQAEAQDTSVPQPKFTGHLLLVEDTPTNQIVAKTLLEQAGLSVDIANDGIAALDLADKNNYDLIFMDCLMPNMDGYEATQELRLREKSTQHKRRMPVVAMTASALAETRAKCLDAGMDDFISKPFSEKELHDMLSKWLKKSDYSIASKKPHSVSNTPEIVVEESTLRALEQATGDKFQTIVSMFIDDTQNQLDTMATEGLNLDISTLIRFVHSIKSTGATFGASELSSIAGNLENKYRGGDLSSLTTDTSELSRAFNAVKVWFFEQGITKISESDRLVKNTENRVH